MVTSARVAVHGATFSEFVTTALVVRDTHDVDVASLLRQLGLG